MAATVVRDPEWLPSDYEHAIAWHTEQELACGGCGVPRDEAWVMHQDRDAQRAMEARARASVRRKRCVYCQARDDDQAAKHAEASEAKQRSALHGIHWVFQPDGDE